MDLFLPNKYPVTEGMGLSVGFCTVWNKPEVALAAAPDLLRKSAIVGTLYSRQGVNPLLRNLALNPQIRTLALWGFGSLSNTPFGKSGTNILQALWKHGIGKDGIIPEVDFQIEPEINPKVVEQILSNVELLDLSTVELKAAVDKLPSHVAEPYMAPVAFDPPAPRPVATLPHETVGFTVRGQTVLDAWQQAVLHVMRYGVVKGTQYGMEQRELPAVQWVVENQQGLFPTDVPEDWPKELRETVGVTKDAIEAYHQIFLSREPKPGIAYTYGSRLRQWKLDGVNTAVDQVVTGLIGNLANSPDSRRAVATTLVPAIDATAKEPPCLISVQCLQSLDKLHLFATFRSQDIFKAAIPNAFGLLALQREITEATGFAPGSLCIQSVSAHIYEGDFDHAKKLIDCSFLDRAPKRVWEAKDADPRGSFIVRLEDGEIVAEHQGPDGAMLGEYRGKTAKDISLKVSQLALVSQVGHALDLGHELQKAEHAIKLGVAYGQDQPLKL
ncbi:MAG: thymidylate synthase [Patescibacteria group bacterium]